jgi:hypothetical protein
MDVDDTNSIETESVEVGFEAKVDRIPIAASCPAFRYYSSLARLWPLVLAAFLTAPEAERAPSSSIF